MFDRLTKGVMARLERHAVAVKKQRDEIERERAGDHPREWAGRFLRNSEGYSTSPAKAAENAQKEYARARREWEKVGAPMLASALAMMVARERRDEAAAVLKAHEDSEFERQRTRVHPEVRPFFATMFDHGLEPRHLANVRVELIAILADLIRWDGADREWNDADNPVPHLFRIYATRLLEQPNLNYEKPKSMAGEAVAPRRFSSDTVHYMINETMRSFDSRASDSGLDPADIDAQVDEDGITPDDDMQEVPAPVASPPMGKVEPVHIEIAAVAPAPIEVNVYAAIGAEEYALPAAVSAAAAAKLRTAATELVDMNYDDWDMELLRNMNWKPEQYSDAEAIAKVAGGMKVSWCAPFEYFLDTARREGKAAGFAAYREATIKRFMLMIATDPTWAEKRKELGIE